MINAALGILFLLVASSTGAILKPASYNLHREKHIGNYIVRGQYATRGQFPYQVALQSQIPGTEFDAICGGSIIARRTILTAAHCFVTEGVVSDYSTVFLGANDISNSREPGQVRIKVTSSAFVIHEKYDQPSSLNDIALVILPLANRITYSSYIQPVRYANVNDSFVGYVSTVSGWGVVSDETGEGTDLLKYTQTKIISNEECSETFNIQDSNVCDRSDYMNSTCEGDSGGPVVVYRGGIAIQVGVVSYGGEFCETIEPSVSTRVSFYSWWIVKYLLD